MHKVPGSKEIMWDLLLQERSMKFLHGKVPSNTLANFSKIVMWQKESLVIDVVQGFWNWFSSF